MKDHRKKLFKNAQLNIEGNIIRCENNSLQISNISQMWAGKLAKEKPSLNLVLFILLIAFIGFNFLNTTVTVIGLIGSIIILSCNYFAQGNCYGLHIELCSGKVYSFLSDNTALVNEVFQLINEHIRKDKDLANYNISFTRNEEIINDSEQVEEEELKGASYEEEMTTTENIIYNEKLVLELQVLYKKYKEKDENEEESLVLIDLAIQQIIEGNKENIRETFGRFIALGLINDCNELSLDLLLQEIKACIYGTVSNIA